MIGLNAVTSVFLEKEANAKGGTILQMLENIKNQYIGRPHMPHSHMIEYGIHAVTLKGTTDIKVKGVQEREKVMKIMGLLEQLIRVNDQLDE